MSHHSLTAAQAARQQLRDNAGRYAEGTTASPEVSLNVLDVEVPEDRQGLDAACDAGIEALVEHCGVRMEVVDSEHEPVWGVRLHRHDSEETMTVNHLSIEPPKVVEVMADLANNSALVDGHNFRDFALHLGYDPDAPSEEAEADFNQATVQAHELHRFLGDEGFGAFVHRDPDQVPDLPEPVASYDHTTSGLEYTFHPDDLRYQRDVDEATRLRPGPARVKALARVYGYDISDDDARTETDDDGWEHVCHDLILEDPDTGAEFATTFRRGHHSRLPDAPTVMAQLGEETQMCRDTGWSEPEVADFYGLGRESARELMARAQRFEAFVGDRAPGFFG